MKPSFVRWFISDARSRTWEMSLVAFGHDGLVTTLVPGPRQAAPPRLSLCPYEPGFDLNERSSAYWRCFSATELWYAHLCSSSTTRLALGGYAPPWPVLYLSTPAWFLLLAEPPPVPFISA